MRTHTRHVLMGTGPLCTKGGVAAEAMFGLMGEKSTSGRICKLNVSAHCMVACKVQGPFLVVYPEGVWHQVRRRTGAGPVAVEYRDQGCQIGDLVFHRIGEGDIEIAGQFLKHEVA